MSSLIELFGGTAALDSSEIVRTIEDSGSPVSGGAPAPAPAAGQRGSRRPRGVVGAPAAAALAAARDQASPQLVERRMYRIVVPPTLTPKEMEAAGVTGETGVLRLTLSYSPKTEESHEFPLPLSLAASPTAEGVRKVVHASSLLPRLLIASKRQGERDGAARLLALGRDHLRREGMGCWLGTWHSTADR